MDKESITKCIWLYNSFKIWTWKKQDNKVVCHTQKQDYKVVWHAQKQDNKVLCLSHKQENSVFFHAQKQDYTVICHAQKQEKTLRCNTKDLLYKDVLRIIQRTHIYVSKYEIIENNA